MRRARIKEDGNGYYHIISRIIERQWLLDDAHKERLRKLMRDVEDFSGVPVITYAILDNHFHILLHVPARQEIGDEELLRRLALLYDQPVVTTVRQHLGLLRHSGQQAAAEALKRRYTHRMYELSEFVKTFKQRLSQGYNRAHGRHGTLWEGRFKSLLVQGSGSLLRTLTGWLRPSKPPWPEPSPRACAVPRCPRASPLPDNYVSSHHSSAQ